jgi:hypothetical protein
MRLIDKVIFILLFGLLLFVSLNRHSRNPEFNYHSQLFADKAGYHIYSAAFFYYEMNAENLPEDIVKNTGNGFRIKGNKVITKYPIGVAVCQSPFFGVAALYDKVNGNDENAGFTKAHHLALNWSTAIWGILGLLFIFITAIKFWNLSHGRAYLLVVMLLFASNLLYYMTRDCGMSHTYSFTVFAALQFIVLNCFNKLRIGNRDLMGMLILLSLIVVLRPLNLIFISIPVLYILWSNKSIIKELKLDIKWFGWVLGLLIALVPVALQASYNHYAYGKLFADSYANETFSNFGNLDVLALWFAPNNGALLYSPVLLLLFVAIIRQVKGGNYKSLMYLSYFLLISITYASWWSPELGCGFGHRGFTEHLAFFALPIAGLLVNLSKSITKVVWLFTIAIAFLLFVAQLNFDGCWQVASDWDWAAFFGFFKL